MPATGDALRQIMCFGEALWDMPPGGRVPGGAPMNVALRLNGLGADVTLLTRVGNDDLGRELLAYLADQGLETGQIQIDDRHPTGRVLVDLSDPHEARYDIERPAAWDFIEFEPRYAGREPAADVFVFGSLAARSDVSRHTLFEFLQQAKLRVFDVNLRPPFVDREHIHDLLERADWVKLNADELELICAWNGIAGSTEHRLSEFANKFGTDTVCVTLGRDGALLRCRGQLYNQKGFDVQIVDTIGCGDSFLATWLFGMLAEEEPQHALRRACAVGALVGASMGANPTISEQQIRALVEP